MKVQEGKGRDEILEFYQEFSPACPETLHHRLKSFIVQLTSRPVRRIELYTTVSTGTFT